MEIVKADVGNPTSLQKAFGGAHLVFSSTVTIYDSYVYEHEVSHGRTLVDTAISVGAPHYIYSTLPNAGKNSSSKLTHMGHFDGKEEEGAIYQLLAYSKCLYHSGFIYVQLPCFNNATPSG